MKIKEINTNIMYVKNTVIAHGVNCQGVMGAGVAKILRAKYPDACKAYFDHCKANKPEELLGTILVTKNDDQVIVHCFTQQDYGTGKQQVSYDAIRSCIKSLNEKAKEMKWPDVTMPKIGAGLGGGNWETIVKIIEEESKDFQPIISIISK